MEPGFVSIFGFGAIVIIGGLIMAAVSFFSMKETNYESVMEKKRREIGISTKVKAQKHKREQSKKKPEIKKKKVQQVEKKHGSPIGDNNRAVKQSANVLGESGKADNLENKEVSKNAKVMKQKKEENTSEMPLVTKAAQSSSKLDLQTNAKKQLNSGIQIKSVGANASATSASDTKTTEQAAKKKISKKNVPSDKKKNNNDDNEKSVAGGDKKSGANVEKKNVVVSGKKTVVGAEKKSVGSGDKKNQGSGDKKIGDPTKKSKVAKQVEGGNSLTKGKSPNDQDLIELIRSATIDDSTVSVLVDLLNEKSRQSDWTTAETGSRKGQVAELQRQLIQKDGEHAKLNEEYRRNQLKLKQQSQELESLKQKDNSLFAALEQTKYENSSLKQQIEKQMEQQQTELLRMQSQVKPLKTLKDENDLLRQTIQTNAGNLADQQREMILLQAKLEESVRDCEKAEMQLADYQRNVQRQSESESVYSKHVEELKLKLLTAETQFGKLENEYKKTQNELQFSQSESAKLLDQVVMLNDASDQRSSIENQIADTKQALEQRLVELDANEAERAEELVKLHTRNKDLMREIEQLEMEKRNVVEQFAQHKASVNKVSEDMQMTTNKINEKEATISALQLDVKTAKKERKQLEVEIEKLKKKNNELRERNWKAMDAVAAAEKSFKDSIAAQKMEADSTIESIQEKVKKELQQTFPLINVQQKQEFLPWLSEFLVTASQSYRISNEDEITEKRNEINEVKQQNNDLLENLHSREASLAEMKCTLEKSLMMQKSLESEVSTLQELSQSNASEAEKYKSILASTENILSSLQNSVENEEREKSKKSVSDAQKIENLLQKLEAKSMQLDELSTENKKLQSDISKMREVEEKKRSTNVEDQGFLIVDQVEQNGMGQSDEMTKLKERLEKEKALTKNLGAAANKLQSLLKQTQDELSKERIKNKSADSQENDKELD